MSEEKIAEKLIEFHSSEFEILSSSETKVEMTVYPLADKYIGSLSAQANALVLDIAKALDLSNVETSAVVVVDGKASMKLTAQLPKS